MAISKVYKYRHMFIRFDDDVGFLIYNRKNGFIYAYSYLEVNECIRKKILEGNDTEEIFDSFIPKLELKEDRLLPNKEYWQGVPQQKLKLPLVINWLISNVCTHKCNYCYADDIIDKINVNDNFESIANNIIMYKPLNVVISGGEPLLNDDLYRVVEYLSNKTGITIDTNGHCYEKIHELLPIIKKNNVHVRVSLDTVRANEMFSTRPTRLKNVSDVECMNRIFRSIEILLENDIDFTIQTVMTKRNANDLENMGDKLWKMGVKVWRIFELQVNDSYKDKCKNLLLDSNKDHNYRKNIYFSNKVLKKSTSYWKGMSVLFTPAKGDENNVFLVLPDGTFQTQPINSNNKDLIDINNPFLPSSEALKNLNWREHFKRYIG